MFLKILVYNRIQEARLLGYFSANRGTARIEYMIELTVNRDNLIYKYTNVVLSANIYFGNVKKKCLVVYNKDLLPQFPISMGKQSVTFTINRKSITLTK